jgi:hypothetical protein
MAVDTKLASSASGASDVLAVLLARRAAAAHRTARGSYLGTPMATVHFAVMTGALLAGWMAVRAKC